GIAAGPAQSLQCLRAVLRHRDLDPAVGEGSLDQEPQVRFVFHQQDVERRHRGSGVTGRRRVTRVPRPGALSRWACPPDWEAKPKTWLSPSPLPRPTSLVVKNGSNTRSCSSSRMPVPSSATVIAMNCGASGSTGCSEGAGPAAGAVDRVMVPPDGIASRL